MEPKPEDFLQVAVVYAQKPSDSIRWCCQAVSEYEWRCGRCAKGILLLDDESCRVCHAAIVFEKMVNWAALREAQKHIAYMEWRRENP